MPTKFTFNGSVSTAWATAANWTPAGPPANGDTAIFDGTAATNGVAGSDQSAVTLLDLIVYDTFGSSTILFGSNGTPLKINVSGQLLLGAPSQSPSAGNGCNRINIDLATSSPTVNIINTSGTSADTGKEPVRLRLGNASAVVNVLSGTVGIATDNPADTATIGTLTASGGTINLGYGVTWTTINNHGADLITVRSAGTTIQNFNGNLTTTGTTTYLIGTITAAGGTVTLNHRAASGNSVTTVNLRSGTIDLTKDGRAIQLGTINDRGGDIFALTDTQLTIGTALAIDWNGNTHYSSQLS